MKKALSLLTLLVVVGFSATGHSADKYVSAHGGMVWFDDSDVNYGLNSEAFGVDMKAGIDQGITALGAFGCDYGAFRVEGEIGYQGADFESLTVGGPMIEDLVDIAESADFWNWMADDNIFYDGEDLIDFNGPDFNLTMEGDLDVYTLMANGYYDIDLGSGVELYLSAGAGVAQIESSNLQLMVTPSDIISDMDPAVGDILGDIGEDIGYHIAHILGPEGEDMILTLLDNVEPDAIGLNVSETTLAYQLGAGIGIPVADNIMLDLKYRYFATLDFTVDVDLGVGAGVGAGVIQHEQTNGHPPVAVGGGLGVTADTGFNTSITNHSALAGLRIMF